MILKHLHDPPRAEGQVPGGREQQRRREAADGHQHFHLQSRGPQCPVPAGACCAPARPMLRGRPVGPLPPPPQHWESRVPSMLAQPSMVRGNHRPRPAWRPVPTSHREAAGVQASIGPSPTPAPGTGAGVPDCPFPRPALAGAGQRARGLLPPGTRPPASPALGQAPRSPAIWLPQGRHYAAGLGTLRLGCHLPDTCWDTPLSRDWQWRLENTERKDKRKTSEVTG